MCDGEFDDGQVICVLGIVTVMVLESLGCENCVFVRVFCILLKKTREKLASESFPLSLTGNGGFVRPPCCG